VQEILTETAEKVGAAWEETEDKARARRGAALRRDAPSPSNYRCPRALPLPLLRPHARSHATLACTHARCITVAARAMRLLRARTHAHTRFV
jgi:hypothetical protein